MAPQPIEQQLKRHPAVAEAMLVGDRRPFIAAVLIPDFSVLAAQLPSVAGLDRAACVERTDVQALFAAVVDDVNATLAPYQRIKRFVVLPRELSVERGELTPTLKIKRRVVMERWRGQIDSLYAGSTEASK